MAAAEAKSETRNASGQGAPPAMVRCQGRGVGSGGRRRASRAAAACIGWRRGVWVVRALAAALTRARRRCGRPSDTHAHRGRRPRIARGEPALSHPPTAAPPARAASGRARRRSLLMPLPAPLPLPWQAPDLPPELDLGAGGW